MLNEDSFVVYGGTGHHGLDQSVLELVNNVVNLRLEFKHIWHQTWPDGEPGFVLEDYTQIKGRHVIIFTCPINYELEIELEQMIGACKLQCKAKSVTVVMSFIRYRRQDRSEKNEEITRLRLFIYKLKAMGADKLIVCEPHSVKNTKKYCKEFNLELRICDPTPLIAEAIKPVIQTIGIEKVRIYSPDFGSVGRAIALAEATETDVIATPKERLFGDDVSISAEKNGFLKSIKKEYGDKVPVSCDIRDLNGLHMFMREDELSTGGTGVKTAVMLRKAGASGVHLIVTIPVCTYGWKMKLFPQNEKQQPFENIWFGNLRPRGEGVSSYKESTGGHINTVDIAPALAKTLAEVLEEISKKDK